MTAGKTLADLARNPELRRLLVDHAYRGFRTQAVVRAIAVCYVVLTLVLLPPVDDTVACWLVAAAYAVWAVSVGLVVRRRDERVLRFSWIALYGDVVALGLVTVLASASDDVTWTAETLLTALFLVPILAAVQLRVWAAVSVMVPTVVVYAAAGYVSLGPMEEPLQMLALRTLALIGVCVGSALLVRIQRSRVVAIGLAATHRQTLLGELLTAESRERVELSERLHDGALQYLLAARQDLDDLPADTEPALAERLRHALGEASALLRAQVADLAPAVLEQAGLATAVSRLADDAAARGRFVVTTDVSAWGGGTPGVERLLYDTARELLANVVKHAQASTVRVTLASDAGIARLIVEDDGIGTDAAALAARLAEGHVGLATRRLRLEAADGSLAVEPREGGGTRVTAVVPL